VDFRQIRSFVHVAELRSLTRAAAFLNVSQPALSRQMRLLEEELRTKLFHRHGRGVSLTHAGALLVDKCSRLLNELADIHHEVAGPDGGATGISGTVSIGLPISVSPLLAHPFLENCRQRYPGISLRIVEGFSPLLHEWLLSGSVDLAILFGPRPGSTVVGAPLLMEDLYAVGAATPENRARGSITPAELNTLPLVLPHRPHPIRELAHQAGIHPAALIEADAMGIMLELARAGKGYTILPLLAATRDASAGWVVPIAIRAPGMSWAVSICHSNLRPLGEAAGIVLRLIHSEVANLVREGRWPATLVSNAEPDRPAAAENGGVHAG
jgi:LysR family nitrogen assimilation transcriptional regulator